MFCNRGLRLLPREILGLQERVCAFRTAAKPPDLLQPVGPEAILTKRGPSSKASSKRKCTCKCIFQGSKPGYLGEFDCTVFC